MKRTILLAGLLIFISVSGLEIKTDWIKTNGKANAVPDKPMKITILPDSSETEHDFFAAFSIIEGKGELQADTVMADRNGNIVNNLKLSPKMGINIIQAKVFQNDNLIKVINFKIFGIDWTSIIVGLIGGLGLFLFGLKYMSEGLQKVAGDRLRSIIASLTRNTLLSVIVGVAVTSIIQSSSATTVMVVGLVNAGLMNLAQSIGVIMGANIGTTVTAQLIAFKLGNLALPAIAVGVCLIMFTKSSKYRYWGEVIFGFGLLFMGMGLMSSTVSPLRESEQIINFFVKFSKNPLLAMLVGMVVTFVIQSSSATVGLTIVLASQGLIDIYGAVPLIFGENIGTTITASLAALSSNREGKRAALIHAMFNILGVTYMMLAFLFIKFRNVPAYLYLVDFFTPGNNIQGENIERYIANSHTIFNIFNTIAFLPFAGVLKFLAEKIVPQKKVSRELSVEPLYLDRNLLHNSAFALGQVRKEMQHMLNTAREAISLSADMIITGEDKSIDRVRFLERKTDILQNQITRYIIDISKEDLTDKAASQIPVYIHSINDIERVGDHAINLTEIYAEMKENNVKLSEQALDELRNMCSTVMRMMDIVNETIEKYSEDKLEELFVLEEKLNDNERIFTRNHTLRLTEQACEIKSNTVFTDTLSVFEKTGDHILNIAQAIYNKFEWGEIV